MRPETAAGAPEARGRDCHCPGDGSQVRPPPHGPESRTPWRPWTLTPRGAQLTPTGSPGRLEPGGDQQALGSKGAFGFQHPVRLYLPISKRQEYLQSSGEKVLASFPVQATIHFYNDESGGSDSESDGPEEETRALGGWDQEAERGPGAQGRARLVHGAAGRGGPLSKGQLPHSDSPRGGQGSSSK
ncbi:protein ripply3 isoform X1 [Lepus europaeus]|uniref:protein ripply3 isoform X1 n=1 Tax=Lepus europaeus TaxID=9983 RepID=UPI002B490BC7|nr:protein ripply3 isoform X1 [Lepus europaeus]